MKKIIAITALLVVAASTYMTLSGSWIAPQLNKWQTEITGEKSYYPALTIFILTIPPLLLFALVKFWLQKAPKKV